MTIPVKTHGDGAITRRNFDHRERTDLATAIFSSEDRRVVGIGRSVVRPVGTGKT